MRTRIIANAVVCDHRGARPGRHDVVITDDRISAIEPAGATYRPDAELIEADGGVVIPGLIDAHVHSHELFMRGQVWGTPLEPYILLISPRLAPDEVPPAEDVYDRTLAACVEMLTGGITFAVDDVEHPLFAAEYVDAVLQAYLDAGMRARVSILTEDRGWIDSIPYLRELLEPDLQKLAGKSGAFSDDRSAQLAFYRRCIANWSSRSDRVGMMVSASAPQRGSPESLGELWRIAEEADVPFHIHVQESVMQATSGPLFYGSSMVSELARLGLLAPRTMVAHGVWLDDGDIATLARAGATVVHNPASNLKLGSGIARVSDLLSAGVNVALGCDGYTCNDAQDMVEAMKLASLLSSVASSDPRSWLGPQTALAMATAHGAKAVGRSDLGILEPGAMADLVVFDPLAPGFLPLGDPLGQLVYAAKRGDVRTVLVGGAVVVRDGAHVSVDVRALRRRLEAAAERYWSAARRSLQENRRLTPAFETAYLRAEQALPDGGTYRWVPDGHSWTAVRRSRPVS